MTKQELTVIQNWLNNLPGKTKNLKTDGSYLKSHWLYIGRTFVGKKYIGNFTDDNGEYWGAEIAKHCEMALKQGAKKISVGKFYAL